MIYGTLPFLFLAGIGVGAFAAAFGVGGGVLIVPLLTLAFSATQHVAEGTSLLVIVPTALFGSMVHLRNGLVHPRLAAALGVGGMLGALGGGVLALRLSSEFLENAFGILVAFMGVRMIRDGIAKHRAQSMSSSDVTPTS